MAANVAVIVVFTAFSVVALLTRGTRAAVTLTKECPDSDTVIPVEVTTPGTTLKLQCGSSGKITPDLSNNSVKDVFCDQSCESGSQKALSDVCPGATGTKQTQGVALTFPQLVQETTTIYLKCHQTQDCIFAITLREAPLQGPQACAVKGTTVQLALQGATGAATFSCGPKLQLKQKDLKKAYKDDCSSEEDLKDLTLTSLNDGYYKLAATRTPSTKTLCYLCVDTQGRSGGKDDYCRVLISVSAGTRIGAVSAFGLALPWFLTLLHLT